MKMTRHAERRIQQRAIPGLVTQLLLDFGSRMRRHGADVVFIDKLARRELCRAVGGDRNMRTIEPWLGTYFVVADDGTLVTAAHRTRRLQKP
jgi:hypothetical protein